MFTIIQLRSFIFIVALVSLVGCNKNEVAFKVQSSNRPAKTEKLNVIVSNVKVADRQITITGENLLTVSNFSLKKEGGGIDNDFIIVSKTSTVLVVEKTLSNLTHAAGKVFDFILSNARAATAVFSVNFSLCDATLNGVAFDCNIAPTDKQVLSYINGKWTPRSVNGLNYIGAWNTSITGGISPDLEDPGSYYIIDAPGTMDGSVVLRIGDWIVSNGATWQKVENSTVINSVFGRTGNIVATKGDYDLTKLADVIINNPANNQVLKYNGTNWVNSTVTETDPNVSAFAKTSLPNCGAGKVLYSNGTTITCVDGNASGGSVTGVTSANADIGVATGATTPVLTLNSGAGANQIIKLSADSKLPAVDGSLLTNLTSANLVGAVPLEKGGTGATTLGASQSALGITLAGSLSGNVPKLGAIVIANRLCASDSLNGTISCIDNLPAARVRESVLGTSGTGDLLFGTSPTISNPVITNIAPAADFTLTQNSVMPFTSVNEDAVDNTLYLKEGKVGIGTNAPLERLHVNGTKVLFGATATTDNAMIYNGSPGNGFMGLYDSANGGKVYGISRELPSPAGTSTLGGYYKGMGIGGSTHNTSSPIFGVLTSSQSNEGIGATAFTIYDTNRVLTYHNVLDDGSGKVGIGIAIPTTKLHVKSSSDGETIATFTAGSATCTLTPTAGGSLACSSDKRLKKNIETFPDMDSLDKILKLRTVTYNWRNVDNGRHTGYIAQEIEKVAPEFVRTGDDGYKQVSYSGFIPWITGAIKSFYGEFKILVARVVSLEDKNVHNERLIASVKKENEKLIKENEEIKERLTKIEKLLENNK